MARVWRVVHKPRVALRSQPNTSGEVLGSLGHGTVVNAVEASGSWIRLALDDDRAGWVLTDGKCVGLGQLLERIDKTPMRLQFNHPSTGILAGELEFPGDTCVGDVRQKMAKFGVIPSMILPCGQEGQTSVANEVTLYAAGYRDGDHFKFAYIGDAEATPVEEEDLPMGALECLQRLRFGRGVWSDICAAVSGGWEKACLRASLEALVSGCSVGPILFEWALSPQLGQVERDFSASRERVVVIFGWGGATLEQLAGPCVWWQTNGWGTIVATRSPRNTMGQINEIASSLPKSAKVIAHVFSNNGLYMLKDLRQKWVYPLAGVIIDSAPDPSLDPTFLRLVANGCIRALAKMHDVKLTNDADDALASVNLVRPLATGDLLTWEGATSSGQRRLLAVGSGDVPCGEVVPLEAACWATTDGGTNRMANAVTGIKLLEECLASLRDFGVSCVSFPDISASLWDESAPLLAIYSSTDTLVKAPAVETFLGELRHRGKTNVRAVRLDGSHHVCHFKRHKERYAAELANFVQSLGF